MTKMNKDDAEKNAADEARIKRRSILKAGAVIAPLALTLHGGIPMAHANSTGCLDNLKTHVNIPNYKYDDDDDDDDHDDHYDDDHDRDDRKNYTWDGTTSRFDPERDPYTDIGNTGRPNHEGNPETHWEYLENEELYGASCLQSIENSGYYDDHDRHDDDDD